MSDGMWVVLGAAVGTAGSIATTWLSATLSRRSAFPKYDAAVVKLLRDMLEADPRWRKLDTLAKVTGLTPKDAKEYLIEMGARGSSTDGNLWGLISRNPLPAKGRLGIPGIDDDGRARRLGSHAYPRHLPFGKVIEVEGVTLPFTDKERQIAILRRDGWFIRKGLDGSGLRGLQRRA